MSDHYYVACDLGAESGRVMLGHLNDGKLTLQEIHRFPTGGTKVRGSLRWNVLRLFEELKSGLAKIAEANIAVESLSVDSWGVDYVLVNEKQPMLALPHHYRDNRTDKTFIQTQERIGSEKIFSETGIQFMSLNTLYQLVAEVEQNPRLLEQSDHFLTIADYLIYLFSGEAQAERSNASTTQLYNPVLKAWSEELIRLTGIPRRIFPEIVDSGTVVGTLLPEIQEETRLPQIQVVATCSHDTGAAVAAVPAHGHQWAYLSSGTWSLIGVELPSPLINEEVRTANFTNEAGYGGTTRFLKNIVGLWILQEAKRSWDRAGQSFDYSMLNQLAAEAEPFRSLINPDAEAFLKPGDMPSRIADFCNRTGQPVPETPGQFVRCILESLALLYSVTLEQIEKLTGRQIAQLHIVGGGSQSTLLNQFTADATNRTVHSGPVEATAIGNILMQAIALRHLRSLDELRDVVRRSFSISKFSPEASNPLAKAHERFAELKKTQ